MSSRAVPLATVQAAAILDQATGTGAQPVLALTRDSEFYWCKLANNPQGVETVVFEVIASVIGKAIDAPIPDAALVEIPAGIADLRYRDGTLISTSGFGSMRVPGVVESDVISHERRDGNPARLPRLMALSELCMAGDFQVMYQDSADQQAYGFDFGDWFDNDEPGWSLDAVVKQRETSYSRALWEKIRLDSDALLDTRVAVESLTEQDIQVAIEAVPNTWGFDTATLYGLADEVWRRKNCTLNAIDQKLKEVG